MFTQIPSSPLSVSVVSKDCVIAAIERNELTDYIEETREHLEMSNRYLGDVVTDTGKNLFALATRKHGEEIGMQMQEAFLVGVYTAYFALTMEEDEPPFLHHNTLRCLLDRYDKSPESNNAMRWINAYRSDENLGQIITATELMSPDRPARVVSQLQMGAGFVICMLNDAFVLSN